MEPLINGLIAITFALGLLCPVGPKEVSTNYQSREEMNSFCYINDISSIQAPERPTYPQRPLNGIIAMQANGTAASGVSLSTTPSMSIGPSGETYD